MRAHAGAVALRSSGHLDAFATAPFAGWATHASTAAATTATATTAAAAPFKFIDQSLHPRGNTILAGLI